MTGSQAELAIKSLDSPSENKPIELGENTAQPTADKMSEHDIKNESTDIQTGDRESSAQDTQLATGKINGSREVDVSQGVVGRIIGHVILPPGESLLSSLHDGSSLAQMDAGREEVQNYGQSQTDLRYERVQNEMEGTLAQPCQDVPCEISQMSSYSSQTVEKSIVCQDSLCSASTNQCQIDSYTTRSDTVSASINIISSSNTRSDALSTNISSYQSQHTHIMCSSQGTQEDTTSQNKCLIAASQENTNIDGFKNNESNIETPPCQIKLSTNQDRSKPMFGGLKNYEGNIESRSSQIKSSTSQDTSSSPPYIQSSPENVQGQNDPSVVQVESGPVQNSSPSVEISNIQNVPSALSQAAQNGSPSSQISCVPETSASSVECLSTVSTVNQSDRSDQGFTSGNQSNLHATLRGVKNNHETNNPPSNQGQNDTGKSEIDGISQQNESCEPGLVQDNEINMSQMERKSSFKTSANPSEKLESGIPGPVLHEESGISAPVEGRSGFSGPLLDEKSGINGSVLDSLSSTYQGNVFEGVARAEVPVRGSQNQIAEHGMTFVPEMSHENNIQSVESHCSKTDIMSMTCHEPQGRSGGSDTLNMNSSHCSEPGEGSAGDGTPVIKSSRVTTGSDDLCQETLISGAVHETRVDDLSHCNGMQLNTSHSDLTQNQSEPVDPDACPVKGDESIGLVPPTMPNGIQLNTSTLCLTQSQPKDVNPNPCPVNGDESMEIFPPTLNAASGKESYSDIMSGSQEGKGTSQEQMSASQKDTGTSQEKMLASQKNTGVSQELKSAFQKGEGASQDQIVSQKGEGNSQELSQCRDFTSACQLLSDILDATVQQIEEAVRISGNSLHLNTWTSDSMQGRHSEGQQGQGEGQGRVSRSHGSDSNLVSCLHHSTQQRYETQAREPLNVSFASPLTEHHTYSPCPSPSQTSTIDLYDDEPVELSRSEVAAYFENINTGNGGEQGMDIDLSCSEMERQSPQLYDGVCSNENGTVNVNQNVNADNMFQPIQKPPRFQAGLPTYIHASMSERNHVFKEKSLSPHTTRPQTLRETPGLVAENYHNLNSATGHYAAHFTRGSESAFHHVSQNAQTAEQHASHSMEIQHGKIQHVSQTAPQHVSHNINTETASSSQEQLNQETKLLDNYGSRQEFNSESKSSTDYGNKIENPKIAVEDLPLNGSCELFDSPQVPDNLEGIDACNDLPRSGQAGHEPSIPVLCKTDILIENTENNAPCLDRGVSPELFSQNDSIAHEGPDKLPIVHGSPQQDLNNPAGHGRSGILEPDETTRSLETNISRAEELQPQLQLGGKPLPNEMLPHYTSEDKSYQPHESVNPVCDPAKSHTIIDQGMSSVKVSVDQIPSQTIINPVEVMTNHPVGGSKPDFPQASVEISETSQPREVSLQRNVMPQSLVCKIRGIRESGTPCKTQTETQGNLNPDSRPPELKQAQTGPPGCPQTTPGLVVKDQTAHGPKEQSQTSSIDPQTSSIDPLPCSAELFSPNTDPQSNDFPACEGNPKLAQASLNVPDMSSQNITSAEQKAKTGPGRRDLYQDNSSLNNDVDTGSATDGLACYQNSLEEKSDVQNSQGVNPDVHNNSGDLFVSQPDRMETQPAVHVSQQSNMHGYVKLTLHFP